MSGGIKIASPLDGLSYKRRLFARYLARGESRASAATLAGYKDQRTASRLMRDPAVLNEVDRVTLELEQDQRVSLGQHLARLEHLSNAAEGAGNYAAAVAAAVSQGKASRLYVEQSHVLTAAAEPVEMVLERLNGLIDDSSIPSLDEPPDSDGIPE